MAQEYDTHNADEESKGYKEWREREKNNLQYLEDVTSHPLKEQEKFLNRVLEKNADTMYLRECGLNGATDVTSFRAHVPVSVYASYKPFIDRIVIQGDKSLLLCADPVVEILSSSGTTGGEPKLFPITAEDLELRGFIDNLSQSLLSRAVPGLERGKNLSFNFTREGRTTPGGLPRHTSVTSWFKSSCWRERPFNPSCILTSPDAVFECFDSNAAMYCHLLLGLLQRTEVLRISAGFAAIPVRAMRELEASHLEICEDIANGTLSARVKDETMRSAVLPLLRKDPDLAEFVRNQYGPGKSSDGIIGRLWPNAQVIDTICTGTMAAYLPKIANLSDNLPVICASLYAATEGFFGVNFNPTNPTDEIYFTLLPSVAYYEFIAVSDAPAQDEILHLLNVKIGCEYELVVTTISGLYRYRMSDILKVVGVHNSTPVFQFVRRLNTLLSIDADKTDETELHAAVSQGAQLMEKELGLRLLEYTSTTDISTYPGHYVIFWEVDHSSSTSWPTQQILEHCCFVMESALTFVYREGRHGNAIGALELRLVKQGTFDLLANHAMAGGANLSQYKTPRGLEKPALLDIVNSGVYQNALSPAKPPFGAQPGKP